ncbi:hypothetical protein V6N13_027210 [Hibiscus sabdariffa]|uniref:Uncharacterized protein n=2 Tax=Hibiscus sabdariffa TaxID=183260 RepID=A0ABR2B4H7_9ROSI
MFNPVTYSMESSSLAVYVMSRSLMRERSMLAVVDWALTLPSLESCWLGSSSRRIFDGSSLYTSPYDLCFYDHRNIMQM